MARVTSITARPVKRTPRPKKVITPRMPPVWSYSRWSTYSQCPLKAKLSYIDGFRFEGGDHAAADRGTEIHSIAEELLRSKKELPIPPVLAPFKDDILSLRKLKAMPEVELGLTKDWKPCAFDAPDYWWHGALDVVVWLDNETLMIVDWKTGKIRDSHATQLELYALVAFLTYPKAQRVRVEDWYVDKKKKSPPVTYLRRQVPTLMKLWERRITPMFSDTTFAPCPGFLCPWCDFTVAKGSGLCKY